MRTAWCNRCHRLEAVVSVGPAEDRNSHPEGRAGVARQVLLDCGHRRIAVLPRLKGVGA